MNDYTVTAELQDRSSDLVGDQLNALLLSLEPWHVAIGSSPYGHAELRITVPSHDLLQAIATARTILASTKAALVSLHVIEADTGERREQDESIPDIVDPQEAADIIGVSRPAVIGMLDRGELPFARVGQRGTVIPRSAAKRLRDTRAAR